EEEAIAIGDSETDLPLFNLCSYSIALANASDDVKKHANYITRYEEGKGLVEAIEHIVLNILR
ncbi:MAG: phosphoglycolate phosphatase, partial [Candidatus Nitrosothermus koennekii]